MPKSAPDRVAPIAPVRGQLDLFAPPAPPNRGRVAVALDVEACREMVASDRWRIAPGPDGCQDFTTRAGVAVKGYACLRVGRNRAGAHRVAWVAFHGRDIPAGQVIDHLCRRPSCVNPQHLEAVSPKTNTLRGVGPTATNAAKEYCPAGHLLGGANVQPNNIRSGTRDCAICDTIRGREQTALVTAAARHLGIPRDRFVELHGSSAEVARAILATPPHDQMQLWTADDPQALAGAA